MNKAVLVLAGAVAVAAALPTASLAGGARVGVSIAIGGPAVAYFPPPPVAYFPPPAFVYYPPPPVAFVPRPFVYAPPPTVVLRAGGGWGPGWNADRGNWSHGYGGHRYRH